MHILVTADTVGGVWTYTQELVTGLAARGAQVTLVSFGRLPTAKQSRWLEKLAGVQYFPTEYRLEWMQDAESDLRESARFLQIVIARRRPEVLHLNQFCYGALRCGLPKLVVAHSDVLSWSEAVRGGFPEDAWGRGYAETVAEGLAGASVVVAPTEWMLAQVEHCYGKHRQTRVVCNGRSPERFDARREKEKFAASAGRLWDEGKQAALLTRMGPVPMPVYLAGASALDGPAADARGGEGVHLLGELGEGQMRELLARAAIYVATSRYEPFGLAPLEAALSRCAIVANDIESLREVWGEAALYFRRNDEESLRAVLRLLQRDEGLRREYSERAYGRALERYTAERMVEGYMRIYSALMEHEVAAA